MLHTLANITGRRPWVRHADTAEKLAAKGDDDLLTACLTGLNLFMHGVIVAAAFMRGSRQADVLGAE